MTTERYRVISTRLTHEDYAKVLQKRTENGTSWDRFITEALDIHYHLGLDGIPVRERKAKEPAKDATAETDLKLLALAEKVALPRSTASIGTRSCCLGLLTFRGLSLGHLAEDKRKTPQCWPSGIGMRADSLSGRLLCIGFQHVVPVTNSGVHR